MERRGLRWAAVPAKTGVPHDDGPPEEPRMEQRVKWSAPSAATTIRRCAVPTCRAAAVATLRTDAREPVAWLVDLADAGTGEDVCGTHADQISSTGEWVLHDVRTNGRGRPATVGATRSRPLPPAPPRLPDLDLRRPAEPESLDELLAANSPLLSRAFAKSR
jgi:hypothetical protein